MVDIILVAVILIQELLHYSERRDMYNRLMAKDLREYQNSGKNPPQKHIPTAHKKVLDRWRNKGGGE